MANSRQVQTRLAIGFKPFAHCGARTGVRILDRTRDRTRDLSRPGSLLPQYPFCTFAMTTSTFPPAAASAPASASSVQTSVQTSVPTSAAATGTASEAGTLHLLPCPMCGGTAALDWSAVAEYYGRAWQTLHVSCSQDGSNPSCDHSVSLDTDSDRLSGKATQLETVLARTWNQVAVALTQDDSARARPGFMPAEVATALRPNATQEELLRGLEVEAAMHGLASAWGMSTTSVLLEKAAAHIKDRRSV